MFAFGPRNGEPVCAVEQVACPFCGSELAPEESGALQILGRDQRAVLEPPAVVARVAREDARVEVEHLRTAAVALRVRQDLPAAAPHQRPAPRPASPASGSAQNSSTGTSGWMNREVASAPAQSSSPQRRSRA